MPVLTAQPIAGVPAGREIEIEVVYPSVASSPLGRFVGVVMGLASGVPTTLLRVVFSVLLGLLMLPLGLLAYALQKLMGNCYVLTNRSIYSRSIIWGGMGPRIPLADIAQIQIVGGSGYEFHRVGDLHLENAQGTVLLQIPAIQYPFRLKQVILDARAARIESDESLARIQSRR
jgi:hypothetical protein